MKKNNLSKRTWRPEESFAATPCFAVMKFLIRILLGNSLREFHQGIRLNHGEIKRAEGIHVLLDCSTAFSGLKLSDEICSDEILCFN